MLRHFCLSLLCWCIFSVSCVRGQSPQFIEPTDGATIPGRGLRITEVYEHGTAAKLGLQPMDLITKYGKFEIVDHSSYFKARAAYSDDNARVEIEVWRGGARLKTSVPTGRLDIDTNEYNPVAYQFSSIMMSIDVDRRVPEYQRNVEFKDIEDIEKQLIKAREIIDAAERDGTLTRSQILSSRIQMILDDAPEAELKKQRELIDTFIATEAIGYCADLGEDLFERQHYRAAIPLMKEHLRVDPDNVSLRLNLGYASFNIGLWDEAEETADHVLRNPERLSEHGLVVAYQSKMMAAFARRDFAKSILFAEKCFEIEPNEFFLSAVLLAAAVTGDTEKFNSASHKFEEKLPKEYEKFKMQIDVAEALLLARNNQDSAAIALIAKWKDADRIEGRLKRYWGEYPNGDAVVDNFRRLAKQ